MAPLGVFSYIDSFCYVRTCFLGQSEQIAEHIRLYPVIGLHDADVGAARRIQRGIHGLAVAAVRPVEHFHPWVARGPGIQTGRGFIRRTIVHADELDVISDSLFFQTFDADKEVVPAVVNGNKYADFRGNLVHVRWLCATHGGCLPEWTLPSFEI